VKRLARRYGRWLIAVAAVSAVSLLRFSGVLEPLENAAADARARLLAREVASEIVIVGIDAQSIEELQGWPWSRTVHVDLLRRLFANGAAPKRVFFDIDFSSPQGDLADAVFASELARAPAPVLLPAFVSYATGTREWHVPTLPREQFASRASLVSVNRGEPGSDGLTRTWRTSWAINGQDVPSVIDPGQRLGVGRDVIIDYSILPASIQHVSYVDVLEGRVPASALSGKDVFIGNVAVELGDVVAVPVHKTLFGVEVQALAAETVTRGVPRVPPAWISVALLGAWAVLAALAFRTNWTRNVALLASLLVAIAGLSVYAFASARIWLEIAAPAAVVVIAFTAVTLRSLDRQTSRALTFALGLRRRDALLRSIVQSSTDCIICIDDRGLIRTANPAASRLFGCAAGDLTGESIGRFVALAPGVAGDTLAAMHGQVRECDARAATGEVFPVEISVSRVRLNSERLFTAFVRDIRERRAQQLRLQHQATHDSLTGLPNRAALVGHLQASLAAAANPGGLVLLMLDLCRFKEVNDALGHHVGDSVLCEVSRRFAQVLDGTGFVARIGGDEFTVAIDHPGTEDKGASVAQSLTDCLQVPIEVAGIAIEVGVSIGSARFPEDAADAQALLRNADVAMYAAKRRGTPYERYDAAGDANSLRRLAIGGELRAAITGNALELQFQPQVNLKTGRVESCEALVRWFHPVHGPISPAEFIAIAETTDLIRPLTEWTLRGALGQIRGWRESGHPVRIAVNLSARLLQDTAFPAHLAELLESSGVPAGLLELEITESAMMMDPARALRIVQEVHALGVMISIDDFGTGYSSLGYLRDLPVQALKLDKSFVMGMRANPDDRIIVESTAQMAHALELELVAEGVEAAWEAGVLAAAGYTYAQGFHYSRALPADSCFAWITEYNASVAAQRTAIAM
jgi:diguanylate cyclase (GGDEF)-like protein/PAS domain S-box-containing protein